MFLQCLLICIFYFMLGAHCGLENETPVNKNTSFLIIGSSVPAVLSGWILSQYNVSVTISYGTADVDNYLSKTVNVVDGVKYELPRMQPVIFENSKEAQLLVNYLQMNLHAENGFYIYSHNSQYFSLSSSESIKKIFDKLVNIGCLKEDDKRQLVSFTSLLENYNYNLFRTKFSNMTLAELARLLKTPNSFVNCAINLLTINSGMNASNFNSADALARLVFYFLQSDSSLRSYYVKGQTFTGELIKGLMDTIVDDMKSRNVKFLSNHTTLALNVDDESGKVLGDMSDKSKTYDFVFIGDTLDNSRRILQATYDANTGVPKIFKPLEVILNSMNKYGVSNNFASIKLWLNKRLFFQSHLIEVIDSPYPFSIQSIKILTMLTIPMHIDTVLEVIVFGTNGTRVINLDKVFNELPTYLTDMSRANIKMYRIDWIDMGVTMNTAYGNNRLTTSSVKTAGIPNLILSGDWLDAVNSTAAGLERSIVIASQTLKDMVFHN